MLKIPLTIYNSCFSTRNLIHTGTPSQTHLVALTLLKGLNANDLSRRYSFQMCLVEKD